MSILAAGLEAGGLIPSAKRVTLTGSDGTVLEFDATLSETHSGSSQPTDHPVEDGSVVTDHVIDQPDKLEIHGVISNHPILILASVRAQPSVEGGDPATRAEDAYAAIVRLQKTATLITVGTRLQDYEDMLITDRSVTRDKDTSEILDVQLSLREFQIATSEDVDAPEPAEKNDGDKTDQGRKQTTDATASVQAKADTLLVGLAKVFGG